MPISLGIRDRLTVLHGFGTDPGSLRADTYIPKSFPKNGPLVVVLHGSTQSAESYDSDRAGLLSPTNAGWRSCFRGKDGPTTPSEASTGSGLATAIGAAANRSLFVR